MSIRTPNPMSNQQSLLDLQRSKARYGNLVAQLTSGKRIVNPGDDPTGSALVMDFQTSIGRNSAYITQANTATYQLQSAETAVTSVVNTLSRLQEIGASATTSSSLSAAEASSMSTAVDGLRTALLTDANTQASGKYIFAGTMTTTQPFVDVGPTGMAPETVLYAGNGGVINLDVSGSATIATNLPGNTLFLGAGGQGSTSDMFTVVTALRDALANNNTAGIASAYADLQTITTRITGVLADLGSRQASLTTIASDLGDANANLQTIQDKYQSTDYAAAITSLTSEGIAQQATLSTIAKVNSKSLFDYLA